MINKNYAKQIRTCERIKFDQALYILTMYQKKIRKNRQQDYYNNANLQKGVDADQQLEDITYAWKNKWKMDLTKPILNCVTSVYPRILIDLTNQSNLSLLDFYRVTGKFIQRMRVQHQDQTNFKLILNHYDKSTKIQSQYLKTSNLSSQSNSQTEKKQKQNTKYLNCSKAAIKSILNITYNHANNCIKRFQQNYEYIINQDISDVDTEGLSWQVIRPLRFLRQIISRSLFENYQKLQTTNNMIDQNNITSSINNLQPVSQQASQFVIFVNNIIKIMQRVKQSEHGSTLILTQPQIKQLTYVIHPLLAVIYANYKKQILQKQKDFNWKQSIPVETTAFIQNIKNSYSLSKVVLINFDGYQSQYNLQFVKNFKKNLMYISFPKEESKQTDLYKIYSKRFFKKLMFRSTETSSKGQGKVSEDLKYLEKLEELNYNPQNYHYFTSKMYQTHPDKPLQDFNQNMYIYPIRCKSLKQNFPQIMNQSQKQDIQIYQSYFIRFIMKDFMINQIREFNPSYIMISYSGRVHIIDEHFVQIIQDLTKVSNYKLILYPNLTTAFCTEEMMDIQDKDGNQCDYDNFINDSKIKNFLYVNMNHNTSEQQQLQIQQHNQIQQYSSSIIEFFNKIARFLKVSSGTYNLTKNSQDQALISKLKNQFILVYTDQLMTVLGKQYYSIDRIRFKNKDLSIIPKLFQQNLNIMKKTFNKTVPQFYFELYKVLEILLFNRNGLRRQQQEYLLGYQIKKEIYRLDIQDLWQQLSKNSNIQINSKSKFQLLRTFSSISQSQLMKNENSYQRNYNIINQLQQIKLKKNKIKFYSLKQLHFIEISSQKFDQKASIYVKKRSENKQFNQISQQTQQTQGLYDITFLRKDKTQIKIYESTKILYKVDQQKRQTNKFPLLIMNNLSEQKSGYFENYIAQIDIQDQINKERKNIEQKKILAIPLIFKNNQRRQNLNYRSFIVKSDWNYYQTQKYLILYWPTEFDFLKATINKILNRTYNPKITNQIYLMNKLNKKNIFIKVQNLVSNVEIQPRMGCSAYQFEQKLFIFGGFYNKQKNYLNNQHDITAFDLLTYQQTQGQKMYIQNLKGILYNQIRLRQQINNNQKYNSYIRPRMQFQIFQKSQLVQLYEQNHTYKQVILFGGYGQNFIRPFSMLTYYYYQIKFSYQSRNIQMIQKKIIYNKTVPINTKEMTKNLGIIKTNKKNPNTNILQSNKLTQSNSYLSFRNSFKIQKSPNNNQQFKYKFKYIYAEDQYKTFKNQIRKVQQQRTQQFDSSTIVVQKMEQNNHLISLEKDGKKCVISLHLQIPHQKAKKLGCSKQVKLTHQSIINIDFWNSMICAIVKHDFYTKGKYVLVEYNIKSLQNLNFNHDEIPHIALTWVKQFDINLSHHILIACNKNTIAILHGKKLINSQKVKQFIVKKKKTKTQTFAYQIQQKINSHNVLLPQNIRIQNCYSIFFKQRNKILCYDYFTFNNSGIIYQISSQIQLNSPNNSYFWQKSLQKTVNYKQKSSINLNKQKQSQIRLYKIFHNDLLIPLQKLLFIQCFKIQKYHNTQTQSSNRPLIQRILQFQYNKKYYYIELSSIKNNNNIYQINGEFVQIFKLMPIQNINIEKENIEKGIILNKKLEHYYDLIQ